MSILIKNGRVITVSEDYTADIFIENEKISACLLYTSDAADERSSVDLGGRRIIKKKKKKQYSECVISTR